MGCRGGGIVIVVHVHIEVMQPTIVAGHWRVNTLKMTFEVTVFFTTLIISRTKIGEVASILTPKFLSLGRSLCIDLIEIC